MARVAPTNMVQEGFIKVWVATPAWAALVMVSGSGGRGAALWEENGLAQAGTSPHQA